MPVRWPRRTRTRSRDARCDRRSDSSTRTARAAHRSQTKRIRLCRASPCSSATARAASARGIRPSKQRTPGRPVAWRAILTAFSIASAPLLTSIVFFGNRPGATAASRSASDTSRIRTEIPGAGVACPDAPPGGGGAARHRAFAADFRGLRQRRLRHRRRRQRVARLCRRHRRDERRPRVADRRRRRCTPRPIGSRSRLLGAPVRILCVARRAARRSGARPVSEEDDARQQRRRSDRERGQDRAPRDGAPGRPLFRGRIPRADDARAVADEQGDAVQGRIRPVCERRAARAVRVLLSCAYRTEHPECAFACVRPSNRHSPAMPIRSTIAARRRRAGARRRRIRRTARGYLSELAALCRKHGILVIADEVQTGSAAPAGSSHASTTASSPICW